MKATSLSERPPECFLGIQQWIDLAPTREDGRFNLTEVFSVARSSDRSRVPIETDSYAKDLPFPVRQTVYIKQFSGGPCFSAKGKNKNSSWQTSPMRSYLCLQVGSGFLGWHDVVDDLGIELQHSHGELLRLTVIPMKEERLRTARRASQGCYSRRATQVDTF